MDGAEIGDLCHPEELLRRNLVGWPEYCGHRVVHPDVNPAPTFDDLIGGMRHCGGIGDVDSDHQGLAAGALNILSRPLKARPTSGQQRDGPSAERKGDRRGAPDAGGGARYDHDGAAWLQ
jgi:hypothetical protein